MAEPFNPDAMFRLLEEHGVDTYGETSASWVYACPICGKPKFYVRKTDGRFICWYCADRRNLKGRVEYGVAALTGLPVRVCRERLWGGADIPVGPSLNLDELFPFRREEENEVVVLRYKPIARPHHHYQIDDPRSAKGREYLASRGIPLEIAREYELAYSPVEHRVIFPVKAHGVVLGWQGRLIRRETYRDHKGQEREAPKILSSRGIPRQSCWMFQDRLKGSKHAVIAEGPFDALKCHLCAGNVASMGKVISEGQLEVLWSAGITRLYIGLDPDATVEIARLVRQLYKRAELFLLQPPPPYKDLGDMSIQGVYDVFCKSRSVSPTDLLWHIPKE